MSDIIRGFDPVYAADSELLILGSFPSVKSREMSFYYGNKQNRFWKTLSEFFGEKIGESGAARRAFVLSHKIALWDAALSCRIAGSADAAIRDYIAADIRPLLRETKVRLILLNGKKAFSIFCENFPDCPVKYRLMPSTSPANPRFQKEQWFCALSEIFGRGKMSAFPAAGGACGENKTP